MIDASEWIERTRERGFGLWTGVPVAPTADHCVIAPGTAGSRPRTRLTPSRSGPARRSGRGVAIAELVWGTQQTRSRR
jgi:hypothetical protein